MYSKINHSHNGKSIEPGDPGIVQDPDKCSDPEKRVLVKFENGMRVNMFFKQVVSVRPAYIAWARVLQDPARETYVSILDFLSSNYFQ